MLTLYHSPRSRSTRVIALLKELDVLDAVNIEIVTVPRQDGSGARDPKNPHPDGKVPFFVHDGVEIWESSAIMLYLADLFPDAGLNIPQGDAKRGSYLSWFAWYSGVMEPIMVLEFAQLSHPILETTFRSSVEMKKHLIKHLTDQPYLTGDKFTAADLLVHSPYSWFDKPGDPIIDAWVDRCVERPASTYAIEFDNKLMSS